jgi:hypothetical protein
MLDHTAATLPEVPAAAACAVGCVQGVSLWGGHHTPAMQYPEESFRSAVDICGGIVQRRSKRPTFSADLRDHTMVPSPGS